MRLILFANFFPFKKSEPFLVNEFEFSKKQSSKITLFSLYGKPNEAQVIQDEKTQILTPVFESYLDKRSIFWKGIFNFSPFYFHFKALFSVLFSFKKVYWLLVSLFVTRAVLASKAYKDLLKIVNKDEKMVLYFYWGDNLCWIIPYLKKKIHSDNVKIVIRLHGSDLYENLKGNYAPLRKLIFDQVDLITTISEYGKDYLSKRYPEVKNKIKVSSLGVFDHGLNPHKPANTYTIVSASNVIELKRLDLIFDVVQHSDLKIDWYHFGDGPLLENLKKRVKSKRADLTIYFKGHVENAQLLEFYKFQSIDLFINLSTTEGVPVSIMEALSFGIPVLAPNIGGIGELVNDTNGKLISVDLPLNEIVKELTNLLQAENRNELRNKARLTFETKASAEANYSNFYSELNRL